MTAYNRAMPTLALGRWGRAALALAIVGLLSLPPGAARAAPAAVPDDETIAFWLDAHALIQGDAIGVTLAEERLALAVDAPSSPSYEPHARFGVTETLTHSLGSPALVDELAVRAEIPLGAAVLLEARGRFGAHWSFWEPADSVQNLDGAEDLQVRLTLLSTPNGESPLVHGVFGAARLGVAGVMAQQRFGPPTVTLWATREGLVGQTTANGHVIQERDRFVALPSRKALNALGKRDYVVRLEYKGRTAEAPVWDVGPWNIRDDYWSEQRETSTDLPRWTSQAEAAFFQNYNNGRDRFGRFVTIPTSIDLADGTFWDDLQMTNNDWIKVTFLWLDAPSPPARATPVVIPKIAPQTEPAAPVPAAPAPPAASSNSKLSASPNPAPAGAGTGTTTVTWDTGDGSFGQVYVWQTGGGETLFAQGISGNADASWIRNGWSYEFRLYKGTAKAQRLRTITVTGNSARAAAAAPAAAFPAPAVVAAPVVVEAPPVVQEPLAVTTEPTTTPVETLDRAGPGSFMDLTWLGAGPGITGGTTISWNAGLNVGQVYVWQPGGGEVLFAEGRNGSVEVPWLQNGWQYEFRLYQGGNRGEWLATMALTGNPSRAQRVPGGEPRPGLSANVSAEDGGSISIAWDTGSGELGQVYWAEEGGSEELFAQAAIGTRVVPRLIPGRLYYFRLYAGTDRGLLLAEVPVTGPSEALVAGAADTVSEDQPS